MQFNTLKNPIQINVRNWRGYLRQWVRWFGIKDGAHLFLNALLKRRSEVKVYSRHLNSPVILRVQSSDIRFYGQVVANKGYAISMKHQPRWIIDGGANIGLAARYFASVYPQARILAVEPEQANFEQLCKNAASYPNIIPIQAALWSEACELEISNPVGFSGTFRTSEPGGSKIAAIGKVTAVTIDQLMTEYQIDYLDLLKLDVEGAEKHIFANPAAWINSVGVITAELHDDLERGCSLNFYTSTCDFPIERHSSEWVTVARAGRLGENTNGKGGHPG